jgi:hypothetical protein
VFNLVTGTGPVFCEAIAAHKLVDLVSFTGSNILPNPEIPQRFKNRVIKNA